MSDLKGKRRMGGRVLAWRKRAILPALMMTLAVCTASVTAAAEGGLLFVSSFSPTIRWTEAMLAAIKAELAAQGHPINLYVEFLDRSRLPGKPSDAEWASFVAIKYGDVRPEAIIADGAPAIKLVTDFGPRLFGNTPVVGIFPNFNDLGDMAKDVAVKVTTGPHIDQTVEMALAHWPTAGKMLIVSDDAEPSHHLARIIKAAVARKADHQLDVEHVFDFRLEDLETKLAGLTHDTIVLYTHVSVDKTKRQFRPEDVAARLAKVSGAPIYALFDEAIGSGVIGGYVNNSQLAGRVAARAALELIDGDWRRPAQSEDQYSSQAVVDWRQLRRWGINERMLPPGVDIRFRQPSVIDAYFFESVIGLAFIGVLSAVLVLILVLFVQRGRHARALWEANSQLEERVAARTRDIGRALAGEQAARQSLRTFLDMATHEFKTPLAVIDSSVQMLELLVDTDREGVGSRLTLIRRSVRRVIDLVETCLAGERIDENLPVKFVSFAPAALIKSVGERQSGHGAVVVADISGLPAECVADPELLGIALDALLDNARRYGQADAPIELIARQEGAALVISVGDRGPGIPEDEAGHVFEKYYRGTHSRGTPGTGIGLNLVKTIADLHSGSIVCQPRDGGGAMFVLTVPLDQGNGPAHGDRQPATPQPVFS